MKKLFVILLLLGSPAVHAHAVLMPDEAMAGSYQRLAIKIGHGCKGSPTNSVTVEIPENVHLAKPMPKSGWQIKIEKEKLAAPYDSHGRLLTEDVARLTWSGGELPDEYYDEFVFHVKLPDEPGTFYFPVKQLCAEGEQYWHQIPQHDAGHQHGSSEYPAPKLELTPSPDK